MSKSQKYIYVVSILNLIGGALYIVLGIIAFTSLGIIGGDALAKQSGEENAGILVAIFALMLVLSGIFSVVIGILGMRAGRDASKIGPVYVVSIISLVITLISIIGSTATDGFKIANIFSVVGPALMFFCAWNVKKQQ